MAICRRRIWPRSPHEMRLAQTEVYEVATFYAHFDVVKEGETPPPPLTVRVCDSLTCELMGAQALLSALQAKLDPTEVRVVRAPCMGRCGTAPVAEVGHRHVDQATPDKVADAVQRRPYPCRHPGLLRSRRPTSPRAATGCSRRVGAVSTASRA